MKCYKLELVGFNDKQERQALYDLAKDCQQIVNRIWQLWESWHVQNNSRAKIIKHLDADRKWRETKKGERPKWPVECIPKLPGRKNKKGNARTLRNDIEADLGENFPQVHARVRTLLSNTTFKGITTRKAASGSLKGWVAILLNMEGRPASTRVLPIPFDVGNSRLVPSDGGNAKLLVRLHRPTDKPRSQSEFTEFELMTSGRAARYVKPILRMSTGEWDYKGSDLFYDPRKKKWFALLSCELPAGEKVEAKPESVLHLRCGYHKPIQVRVNGDRRFLRDFGHGRSVEVTRRQLLTQRWSRQENYRVAGHANKGHGRNRALGPIFLLSQRWKDFCKRYNHNLTSRIVELCLREGIGKVMYHQPSGNRFLSNAGKISDREDSTGWEFFQIASMLNYKCEHHGIEFICRKSGRSGGDAKSLVKTGA